MSGVTSRAVVHIGLHKTGTTSIQQFLSQNKRLLLEEGFVVPNSWPMNHHRLAVLAYDENDWDEIAADNALRMGHRGHRPTSARWRELRDRMFSEFDELVEQSRGKTLVVSSEVLFGRLNTHEKRKRLAVLFEERSLAPTIVVYVREPLAHTISTYSTLVRSGMPVDTGFLSDPSQGVDFGQVMAWEEEFRGSVVVRLFDPGHFHGGNLLRDFCLASNIPWRDTYSVPSAQNESLSWEMLKVLRAVNEQLGLALLDDNGSLTFQTYGLDELVRRVVAGGVAYRPSAHDIIAWNSAYRDPVEALRQRYFPDRDRLWLSKIDARSVDEDALYDARLTESEHALVRLIVETWPKLQAAARSLDVLCQSAADMVRGDYGTLEQAVALLGLARVLAPDNPWIAETLANVQARLSVANQSHSPSHH